MGHAKIDEFVRAHDFKPSFLRDMQRILRDEVQPLLDEREALIEENHRLHEELLILRKQKMAKATLQPVGAA